MVKDKILKSGNRFGVRYGRKNRDKFAKIEHEQRKLHKCPYCNLVKVKRLATGIWLCRKCGAMFAGKAYTVSKTSIKEDKTEQEQPKEKLAKQPEAKKTEPSEPEA